jgi:GntR family transcriptional regulator of gluconate operon
VSELDSDLRFTIRPAQVLGEQVLEQMRVLIVTGQFAVGTHLVEAQLSQTFQVSRGPIRDALAQLEAEGLVESRKRGVFVRGLTVEDIDELYSLRESMELLAIREGAAKATDADWAHVDEPLAEMHAASLRGDHEAFARADLAYHSAFYDVAHHRRLRQVWGQYEPTFGVLLTITTAEDVDLGPSYESHVEIRDRLREGSVDAASASLREHLLGSRNRLITAYARRTMGDATGL